MCLRDIQPGARDPRGRVIREVLWAVRDFKVYRTAEGIWPFFSDDEETARTQRRDYLALEGEIADYNHLIYIYLPDASLKPDGPRSAELVQFERGLGNCLAMALDGDPDGALAAMRAQEDLLCRRIRNRARRKHLMVNVLLVAGMVFLAVGVGTLARNGSYTSVFAFDITELLLAVMMGSVGALFSTTVSLKSMAIDPMVTSKMHLVYGIQRVLLGAVGALVLYLGIRGGVFQGLFEPPVTGTTFGPRYDPHWLAFVCILAGFSERLVPNLLDSRSERAQGAEAARGDGAPPPP